MKKRMRADEAFERALADELPEAPEPLVRMAKLAHALGSAPKAQPEQRFRARLRSEILAAAALQTAQEEDLFAAMLEGQAVEAPAEMRQLVKVASALEVQSPPVPDPAFRYGLRNQLVAQATPSASPITRVAAAFAELNQRMRRSMRVVGATGLAVLMMLGAGASFAASRDANPGDLLYGLKRFQESAQLVGLEGRPRGEKLLGFARVRVGEVDALLDRGTTSSDLFVDTLNDMDAATIEGRDLLLADYMATKDLSGLTTLEAFAREQAADLAVIVDRLPPAARPVAIDSLTLVDSIARHTVEALGVACSVCPEGFSAPVGEGSVTDLQARCACASQGNDDPSSQPGGKNQGPGTSDPGPGTNNPDPDPEDPPTVDVPPLPGGADGPVEDLIDDLVNDVRSAVPTPAPSLPSTPPVPGL